MSDEVKVYVDAPRWKLGRMNMCHLYSPSVDALHAFAAKLGLKRKWFQDKPGFPHYDICQQKRSVALLFGAQPISSRDLVRLKNRANKQALAVHTS